MSQATAVSSQTVLPASTTSRRISWAWLGVVPFFVFALMFLILPSLYLFFGSFQDIRGNWTLDNIGQLSQPRIVNSYILSIEVSAATAIIGGTLGFFIAYAITLGGLPRTTRTALITFCGVASNFAGVPLAFAFIATLGRTGFLTVFLRDNLGINPYDAGFNLYSFWGLTLTYLYFQFPLMVLIITPSLDGMKKEWREAAENLGASSYHYWRYIAIPILLPSVLGTTILLFGNAFGAWATAFALTGGTLDLITILIGAQMRGDVLYNPNLGYALALGMVLVMAISIAGYTLLQGRTEKWLR